MKVWALGCFEVDGPEPQLAIARALLGAPGEFAVAAFPEDGSPETMPQHSIEDFDRTLDELVEQAKRHGLLVNWERAEDYGAVKYDLLAAFNSVTLEGFTEELVNLATAVAAEFRRRHPGHVRPDFGVTRDKSGLRVWLRYSNFTANIQIPPGVVFGWIPGELVGAFLDRRGDPR